MRTKLLKKKNEKVVLDQSDQGLFVHLTFYNFLGNKTVQAGPISILIFLVNQVLCCWINCKNIGGGDGLGCRLSYLNNDMFLSL